MSTIPTRFEFSKTELVPVEHHTTYTAACDLRYAAVSGVMSYTIFGVFPFESTARRFAATKLMDGYVIDLHTGERVS